MLFAKCIIKLNYWGFFLILLWSCCILSYLLTIPRPRSSGRDQLDKSFHLHSAWNHSASSWAGVEDPQRPRAHVWCFSASPDVPSLSTWLSWAYQWEGADVWSVGCIKTGGMSRWKPTHNESFELWLSSLYFPFSHLFYLLRTLSFLKRLSSRLREKILGHWPSHPRWVGHMVSLHWEMCVAGWWQKPDWSELGSE